MKEITRSFRSLNLDESTLNAIEKAGYSEPTEIQNLAIPKLMSGTDVLATAQTGTGKTAAFVLPMLHRIRDLPRSSRRTHALILAPTRELAVQISDSIKVYGHGSELRTVAVFGGASRNKQITELRTRPDAIVATPGRLLDLVAEGHIDLRHIAYLVLDEADRMLDMGFIPTIRKIVAMIPKERQTALFSATMPKEIQSLSRDFMYKPVHIQAQVSTVRVDRISQSVMHVDQADKLKTLIWLLSERQMFRVLVFTRTKHRARKVAKVLDREGVSCDSIHGDKSQGARIRALKSFASSKIQVLVATDVVSRGIDVDDVTHVINFELPNEAETYVHRIGRTARAGSEGEAISFCDPSEVPYLWEIEKLVGISLSVLSEHPHQRETPKRPAQKQQKQQQSSKKRKSQTSSNRRRSRRRVPAL